MWTTIGRGNLPTQGKGLPASSTFTFLTFLVVFVNRFGYKDAFGGIFINHLKSFESSSVANVLYHLKDLPAYPLHLEQLRWAQPANNSPTDKNKACINNWPLHFLQSTLKSFLVSSVGFCLIAFGLFAVNRVHFLTWMVDMFPSCLLSLCYLVVSHGAAEDEVQPAEAGAFGPGPLAAVLAGGDVRGLHILSWGLPQNRAAS